MNIMNNMNMRRILKRPTLRMEDGGQMGILERATDTYKSMQPGAPVVAAPVAPTSAAPAPTGNMGILERATATYKSMQPQEAAVDPNRKANMLAAGARTQTFQPMFSSLAAPEQTRITPMQMEDGGERYVNGKGGQVPGNPLRGDQFPAKYTGGEFVASNAMLNAQPGLREHLSELREKVLADKGMTPEEADAKSMKGGTLQAMTGADWASLTKNELGAGQRGMDAMAEQRAPAGSGGKAAAMANQASMMQQPAGEAARYAAPQGGSNAFQTPGHAGVAGAADPVGRPGGAPSSVPNAGVAPTSTWGRVKGAAGTAYNGAKGAAQSVASGSFLNADVGSGAKAALRGASNFANGLGQLARPAAPAVAAYETANTPTEVYAKRNDITLDGSLGAELAARTQGAMQEFNDAVTFGQASKIANWASGKGYVGNDEVESPVAATPATPATPAVVRGGQLRDAGDPRADPRRLTSDGAKMMNKGESRPAGPTVGASRDFTSELSGRPNGKLPELPSDLRNGVIHKTVDAQGRVTYSGRNVGVNKDGETQMVDGTGRTLKMLNGNNMNFVKDVATGKTAYGAGNSVVGPSGDVSQSLRGGSDRVGAALDAAMARGDSAAVKAYYANKGETFAGVTPEQYKAQQEEANAPKRGEFGFKNYQANQIAKEQNKTQLRAQDINMEVAMAPAKLAAANRDTIMKVMQHKDIGNDPARGAAYLTSVGRPDLAEGLQKQADASLKMAGESNTLVDNKWKNMAEAFKGQYLNPDKDGKTEANTALEQRAFSRLKLTNPTAFNLGPKERSQAIRDAISDEELMQTFSDPQAAGFASWLPEFLTGNSRMTASRDIPGADKLRGASISDRVGGLRGALSPNLGKGDRILRTPGGTEDVNLGGLSDEAFARLQHHIKTSQK